MTRLGRIGAVKPYGETDAGDPSLALLRAQAKLAPDSGGHADALVAPTGNEQLVNTFTTGFQGGPILARGGNDNIAVAWVSIGQDGDSGGVYLRVYAPNGNAVTGEARVNEATAGTQNAPSITTLENGNFVVAWQERTILGQAPQTTNLDEIYYRVYSSNGTPLTGELTANSAIHKSEGLPSVAGLDGGGFAISWSVEFDDGRREIYVRSFNNAGVANANEQFANTSQAGTQTGSRIAGLEGGGYVVVWEDQQGPITTVRAQRFAGNGSPVGGEFAPQAQAGVTERVNDVIALGNGGFVILFSRPTATDENGLYARIYDANGVAAGGEKAIATGAGGTGAELTPLANGGFAAAWETSTVLTGDVHGRLFDAAGNPDGDEFTVNQTTLDIQGLPDVVERADGSLLYAWSGPGAGDSSGVFIRAFDPDAAAPPITGTPGPDVLAGTPGDDVIQGLGDNDILAGLGGVDRMEGGTGNDTYYVDNAADVVVENAGEGFDAVYASTSYVLGAGVEVEWLSAYRVADAVALNLTGNALFQYLIGNQGANILDGAGGADVMVGYGGDDTYIVDNIADGITEVAGQGFDTVRASTSYRLGAGVDVEAMTTTNEAGTGAINLTGNELAQSLTGNAGANILNGDGGADTMAGLGGNDTYLVDHAGDTIAEATGQGFDAAYTTMSYTLSAGAEVEWLSTALSAGTDAIDLTGNAFGQYLYGNEGVNILDGKDGNDILIGLGGADMFQFTTALGASNVDIIADFVSGTDRIALDDAIFTAIGSPGALNANAFMTGSAAADADDRIVYNSTTGQLFYDADGNGAGAAMLFATLQGAPALTASDFMVI